MNTHPTPSPTADTAPIMTATIAVPRINPSEKRKLVTWHLRPSAQSLANTLAGLSQSYPADVIEHLLASADPMRVREEILAKRGAVIG